MNKLLVLVVVLFVVGWIVYDNKEPISNEVGGNTVATTTVDSNDAKKDLIVVSAPVKDMVVSSPFVVSGKARGYWFFEASFPIELRDTKGNVLQTIVAQAQDEWMTTEFVPFTAQLIFTKPASPMPAVLVFKKDNPSGLPEHDDSIEIPIILQ
ncbi:MAG: Gmad2 immunoglobulin-like domain-containing protein [Minisyncoccia bacterium]